MKNNDDYFGHGKLVLRRYWTYVLNYISLWRSREGLSVQTTALLAIHRLQFASNGEPARKHITLLGVKIENYYENDLQHVVQASLNTFPEWGCSGRRNYDMRCLLKSLCVLEKYLFIPESALATYWSMDDWQVNEIVLKFVNINVKKRRFHGRPNSCRLSREVYALGLHDLVLELCHMMATSKKRM